MQVSKFQEHHGDTTIAQLVQAANRANENIHVGFKVVFEHDEYWGCEMFHLMELVEFEFLSCKFCLWQKIIKTDRAFSRAYLKRYCGEFISTESPEAIKRRIPEILERRKIEKNQVRQECTT
jgi:hypothetical protein